MPSPTCKPHSPRPRITTERVHAAADTLAAQGESPTLMAVRQQLGGGSFSTISNAMKIWHTRNPAPAAHAKARTLNTPQEQHHGA